MTVVMPAGLDRGAPGIEPLAGTRPGVEQIAAIVRSQPAVEDDAAVARLRDVLEQDAEIRALWDRIRSAVERTGVALLHGVPLDDHATLLSLSMGLGMPSSVGNGGRLVHAVTPKPMAEQRDVSSTRAAFPLHTDSTALAQPHTGVALGCVETERGAGGETQVLHVDSLRSLLEARSGADCVSALEEPVYLFPLMTPVERDGRVRLQSRGAQAVPILSWSGDLATVRYRRDVLGTDVGDLTPRHRRARAALDALLADESVRTSWPLAAGDVLLLDNRRVLHGRGAIDGDARRLLWRVRTVPVIATPD